MGVKAGVGRVAPRASEDSKRRRTCVHARNGRVIKNVREAWLKAVATGVRKKQLPDDDFRPHDLRRSAITRWTSFGVPRDVVMATSGHKPNGVHDGYVNFSDANFIEAFYYLFCCRRRNLS